MQISNLLTNMNLIINGRVVLYVKSFKRKNYCDKLIVLYCHNYLHDYGLIDVTEEDVVPDYMDDFDYEENDISYDKSLVKYTCGLYESDYNDFLYKIHSYH